MCRSGVGHLADTAVRAANTDKPLLLKCSTAHLLQFGRQKKGGPPFPRVSVRSRYGWFGQSACGGHGSCRCLKVHGTPRSNQKRQPERPSGQRNRVLRLFLTPRFEGAGVSLPTHPNYRRGACSTPLPTAGIQKNPLLRQATRGFDVEPSRKRIGPRDGFGGRQDGAVSSGSNTSPIFRGAALCPQLRYEDSKL